jgi:hypothetical protein
VDKSVAHVSDVPEEPLTGVTVRVSVGRRKPLTGRAVDRLVGLGEVVVKGNTNHHFSDQ